MGMEFPPIPDLSVTFACSRSFEPKLPNGAVTAAPVTISHNFATNERLMSETGLRSP
jgi:hypothetical protein